MKVRSSVVTSLERRLVASVMGAALLLGAASATRASAQEFVAPEADYLSRFEAQLDAVMRTGEFVGLAVGVVDHGRITFIKTYGETAVGTGEAVTPDTAFRFASVSKGFSTALVGQLVEEGRLSWSDPVTQYEPTFRLKTNRATSSLTIEDLASHRVGLPSHAYDNLIEAGRSFDIAVNNLRDVDLICQPGDCYQYQNVAFSLLGVTAETVEGRPFDELMQERVFAPLGMDTASVGREGLMGSESWARGHARRRVGRPWYAFEPNENYYRVAPAGGLNGSIEDLALWARAQMGYNPDVIDDALRIDMQSERVSTPQERAKLRWLRTRLRDADYALGWRVYDYAGERMVMHSGGVSGYRALVAMMPEHDVAVVALWNASNSLGWRILPTFYDAYLGLGSDDWLGVHDLMAEIQASAELSGSP